MLSKAEHLKRNISGAVQSHFMKLSSATAWSGGDILQVTPHYTLHSFRTGQDGSNMAAMRTKLDETNMAVTVTEPAV